MNANKIHNTHYSCCFNESKRTKTKIFETIFVLLLVYGCESWRLKNEKQNPCEMNMNIKEN